MKEKEKVFTYEVECPECGALHFITSSADDIEFSLCADCKAEM